jgi:hypothetical protein
VFLVESSETTHICPKCRGTLEYRDSRKRILKHEGGARDLLMIRRFRCRQCCSYHNELPDCLVPYKHYEAEVISGVIDGVVTPYDSDSEDYPSFETMRRWLKWFLQNAANIEGYLRSTGCSIFGLGRDLLFSQVSLLETIRCEHRNWLEIILRLVYNFGGSLVPIPW